MKESARIYFSKNGYSSKMAEDQQKEMDEACKKHYEKVIKGIRDEMRKIRAKIRGYYQ
mgnify:CR=1 FL=1